MKAELMPLEGKYYGTKIKLTFDDGHEEEIALWDTGDWEPSDRELGGFMTIKQWRNNEIVDTPDGKMKAKDAFELCDSHFESRETLARAQEIVRLLSA